MSQHTKDREWTQAQRDKLARGEIKGEFAGPDQSYPIAGPNDVEDAWDLAGHADDPNEVRRNVIRIAKENGWGDSLPETAHDWLREHGANS